VPPPRSAGLLVDRIADDIKASPQGRSSRGIAAAISRLARTGELRAGERLPTVRALADRLGTSPTTVSEAWHALARSGIIDPKGRLGTFVRDERMPMASRRYRTVTQRPSQYRLDLSTGVPDPDLLPDLRRAVERVSRRSLTNSYLDSPLLPALDEHLRERWPFPVEALTVVDGAMDALDRILSALVGMGDRVIVEDPSFPPVLDLLDQLGVQMVGVEVDSLGIVPSSLAVALRTNPVALVSQPRAHNPTGGSTTPERAAELAVLLRPTQVIVIEDDHAGDIAVAPLTSLGEHLPDRTVLVRSFSKSHGPDLRLAAIGGSAAVVVPLVERRLLGPGWSSRLLQAVLLEMLRDPTTISAVSAARSEYARRRGLLVGALTARSVVTHGADGINLWVDVADERTAALSLLVDGIGAAPGSAFEVEPNTQHHLRFTVGQLEDTDIEPLANAIARAACSPTN
jgi:DNA-binding transcriptional MocR family regulator